MVDYYSRFAFYPARYGLLLKTEPGLFYLHARFNRIGKIFNTKIKRQKGKRMKKFELIILFLTVAVSSAYSQTEGNTMDKKQLLGHIQKLRCHIWDAKGVSKTHPPLHLPAPD